MKKPILLVITIAAASVLMFSCKQVPPTKTIENLKVAINGETEASVKYKVFSGKAAEDSLPNIAKLFAATSKAEAIHVENHTAALEKLGVTYSSSVDMVETAATSVNLQTALKGENYEVSEMYPPFITVSETEKAKNATTSFNWAFEVEKRHSELYAAAIQSLAANGNDSSISSTWYVCPKCGQTFSSTEGVAACDVCATGSANFLSF